MKSFPNVSFLLKSCRMLGWSSEKLASSLHRVQTCTVNTELNRCFFQESLAPPTAFPFTPLFNQITHICFGLVTLDFFFFLRRIAHKTRIFVYKTFSVTSWIIQNTFSILSWHCLNMFASRICSQLNSLVCLKLCLTGSFLMPLCF